MEGTSETNQDDGSTEVKGKSQSSGAISPSFEKPEFFLPPLTQIAMFCLFGNFKVLLCFAQKCLVMLAGLREHSCSNSDKHTHRHIHAVSFFHGA